MIERRPLGAGLLLLAVAALALLFVNGKSAFAVAAFVGPPLLVAFLRGQPVWRGLLLAWAATFGVWVFQWDGVFRLPSEAFWPTAVVLSFAALAPYLVDRLLAPRLAGLGQTLVLPCAFVSSELLMVKFAGFGAWGPLAYGQTGFPLLLQSASLLGFWVITFVIGWWAAVANLVWDNRTSFARIVPAASLFAVTMLGLGVWGAARLAIPAARTLTVAVVARQPIGEANYRLDYAASARRDLFTASAAAARNGARIVAWPEDSFFIAKAEEPALHAEAAAFARAHAIYLAVAYSARLAPPDLAYENRTALFAPDGRRLWAYSKASPVPGYEQAHMRPGSRRPPIASTPLARLATMICFDADHPDMIAMVNGRSDLLIIPSDDWPAVEAIHARMIRVRAVEIGAPILRPTINGRSLIVGPQGQVLGEASGHARLVAIVALLQAPTPYARLGDSFAWVSAAGLGLLAAAALRRR